MKRSEIGEWLRDRVWPTLVVDPQNSSPSEPVWPSRTTTTENLKLAHELLKDELKAEDDRIKVAESKLLSICSMAPLAMTILVAIVTFLTSGRAHSFTSASIIVIVIGGGYIAFQLLLAVRAAIKGLARSSYYRLGLIDIFPGDGECDDDYRQRICKEMTDVIRLNRKTIDEKVSQVALGHEAILSAVWALIITLLLLLGVVVLQALLGVLV